MYDFSTGVNSGNDETGETRVSTGYRTTSESRTYRTKTALNKHPMRKIPSSPSEDKNYRSHNFYEFYNYKKRAPKEIINYLLDKDNNNYNNKNNNNYKRGNFYKKFQGKK